MRRFCESETAMKIAILSRNSRSYSTRRLQAAGRARGHTVRILDTLKFGIYVDRENPQLTYASRPMVNPDAIIPRIGSSITFFGTAVVRQFERMGVFSLNPSFAISAARDKLRCLQALSRQGIGMPPAAFIRSRKDILQAIERVGGTPVIIKLLEGTQGIGVILADELKMAEAIIETFQSTKQNILVQKFVSESKGKDIRALVVGDRVVATISRSAVGQEFRSNVHRGGLTESVELAPSYERTAVRAAKLIGLRVAGVDMLEGPEGPVVLEVNSSPGLKGIEKATGVDIANEIIQHLEETLHFKDIDVRQRLGLAQGYVIAEIMVNPRSGLANKELKETGLRTQEITVLSIERDGNVIPNPSGSHRILSGDLLLCYGNRVHLMNLVAKRRPKRSGEK